MDSEQLAEVLKTFQRQQENFLKTLFQQNPAQQQPQLPSTTINVTHIPPFESYVSSKENFRYYRERFENYLRMKEVFTDKKKSAQLLVLSVGAETYNLLSALLAPKTPNDANYDELIDLLEKHLSPERNELVAQHQFLNIYQSNENSIAEFIAELRRNLTACKFEITCSCSKTNSIADLLLRIQFIRGLRDSSITEQILQSELKEFSLITSKAIALEAAKNDSKTLSKQQTSSSVTGINQTTHMNPSFNQQSRRQNQPTNRSARNRTPSKFSRGRSQQKFPRTPSTRRNRVDFSKLGIDGLCLHCGNKNHATRECRTDPRKLKCASCEKTGHLAKVCITTLGRKKSDTAQVNEISNLDLEYGLHQIVDVYNQSTAATEKYYATVTIQDTQLNFEVDSGAGYAMIPEEMFNQLKTKPTVMPTTIRFRAYTPNIFQPLGKCCVNVTYKNRSSFEEFYIVPTGYDALLGRACIRHLGINLQELDLEKANQHMVNKVNDVSEFKTMFPRVFEQKIGCVPDIEIHLQLREGAKPVYIAARSVPYALRDKVERELDLLEAAEIITKSPTSDWGSPLVVVIKADNTARLCVNYKIAVNDLLVNSNYPIKRIEDVLNSLRNSRYFCRLDLYKAYLHLKVDEESSKIQTAATHRGTYRINRLSFGIKTAPAEFNRVMDMVLRNLQNTIAYFDDIIVHGPTLQNCEENLIECLRRLEKNDLHLNLSKCTFFQTEIEYLGYLIKYNTIGKSPKKVEAILLLPEPTNVADVRHFLGLITYYSRFIPDASTLTAPLRRILQKNEMFRWTSNCKIAFKNLKNEIASDRVVVPYDPSLPVVLTTDASPVGLGAILSHVEATSEKPIAFASRSLTAAEKNYSQLDKEALAIVFGISHFSEYLFGKRFTLVTDNQPLSRIFQPQRMFAKTTSARLIRYASYLSGFDYEIRFKKGCENQNVDCLSRAPRPTMNNQTTDVLLNEEIHTIFAMTIADISSETITYARLKEETRNDGELQKIISDLQTTPIDSEFTIDDGVLFKGTRIVIPKAMQSTILNELHSTHIGGIKMKQLSRRYCYWKGIDKEIEAVVRNCDDCARTRKAPPKAPLHKWDPPEENWSRLHMDYAGPIGNDYFFVLIDAKSRWPEIKHITEPPSSQNTMELLEDIFSSHGYPNVLVSDNAGIFISGTFKNYCSLRGIFQKFIAPGHPATNGLAERNVQTLKNRLEAMKHEKGTIKEKLRRILFKYRTTPLKDGETPAEKYLNRRARTVLDALRPTQHEKSSGPLPGTRSFNIGQRVNVQFFLNNKTIWKPGIVEKKLGNLHYIVKLDEGRSLKRHINQLRRGGEKKVVTFEDGKLTGKTGEDFQKLQPPLDLSEFTQNPQVPDPQPAAAEAAVSPMLRRSDRGHRAPAYLRDFIVNR